MEMKIRAIFRKHFNKRGEGDDFPTDFFHPSRALDNMTWVSSHRPKHDGDYGKEEWEYETEYPDEIEADLERCDTCITYHRIED